MTKDESEAAWAALMALAARPDAAAIRPLFAADPNRFARFSHQAGDILLDFSKTTLSDEVLKALLALAEARDIAGFLCVHGWRPSPARCMKGASLPPRVNASPMC
jgi:glucose-6-phosphate isomerase